MEENKQNFDKVIGGVQTNDEPTTPILGGDKTEAQKKCEADHDMERGVCDSAGNFTPTIG